VAQLRLVRPTIQHMRPALLDAFAQYRGMTASEALVNFVPIALFLVVLYFIFRRQMKTVKSQQDDLQKRQEHMKRVEQLLERIANALERHQ
jgi:membrane protein implicated in regulation of membrane protease activity